MEELQREIEQLRLKLRRSELKTQALLEKVSTLTTTYEDASANLRVEYTLLEAEKQQLATELSQVRGEFEHAMSQVTSEPVNEEDSNVVEETAEDSTN